VYVTFQVTLTMMAGVWVNWALHSRLSATEEIVYRQRLMEAHGYQHNLTMEEFKSTMLFAEAVLQRLARNSGWVRLLGFRLEAYSIIPGLFSGWCMMAKLTQGTYREQAKLE